MYKIDILKHPGDPRRNEVFEIAGEQNEILFKLLDPRLNRLWDNGYGEKITLGTWLRLFKHLFAQDDFFKVVREKSAFTAHWPLGYSSKEAGEALGKDLRWALAFIYLDEYTLYNPSGSWVAVKPQNGKLDLQIASPHDEVAQKIVYNREAPLAEKYKSIIAWAQKLSDNLDTIVKKYTTEAMLYVFIAPRNNVTWWTKLSSLLTNSSNFVLNRDNEGRGARHIRPSELAAIVNIEYSENAYGTFIGFEEIIYDTRDRLYQQMAYGANPLSYFRPKKLDGEEDPVMMGVEMELSTNYRVENLIDACDEPFFIVKRDASVNGNKNYPYELVTCPMSALAQKVYWAQFFDNLDYAQFDTTLDTTNGMHVHVDKVKFTPEHTKKFIWFFVKPQNTEFFFRFSARNLKSFQRYCPVPKVAQGETEEYFFGHMDHLHELLARTKDDQHQQIRGIVAAGKATKGKTLEVRLFKGVVSFADMVKNLELVEAIYLFTRDNKVKNLTLNNFLNFVKDSPADHWEMLKEYLDTLDLNYCLSYSDVFDVVFAETDIKKIKGILEANWEAKGFSDIHITALNVQLGRKAFEYVINEQKVKILTTPGAALARFDSVVSHRYNKKKPIRYLTGKKKIEAPELDAAHARIQAEMERLRREMGFGHRRMVPAVRRLGDEEPDHGPDVIMQPGPPGRWGLDPVDAIIPDIEPDQF